MLRIASQTVGRSVASRVVLPSLGQGVVANGTAKRGYHENIVEHYENPRNVGSLDKNDQTVGTVSILFSLIFDVLQPCGGF